MQEKEILLAPNHTFTPTGMKWTVKSSDYSKMRMINYEVTYDQTPPTYRWDENPADPHWVKE